jgi:hypothetical protein
MAIGKLAERDWHKATPGAFTPGVACKFWNEMVVCIAPRTQTSVRRKNVRSFASLSLFAPGRVYLGVELGEAFNEGYVIERKRMTLDERIE